MMSKRTFLILVTALLLVTVPLSVAAQDGLEVVVATSQTCDLVAFDVQISGGVTPYTVLLEFGDEESYEDIALVDQGFQIDHTYPSHGEWSWNITVQSDDALLGADAGLVMLDGPSVSLSSVPFPPLLTIESGEASIEFTAEAAGGTTPYSYQWDFDADGFADPGFDTETASQTYTEGGDYQVTVIVTDGCGFTASETWPVVVVDPEEEPLEACHPTALKIAEAVTELFPDRADRPYTCKDIFDIFDGMVFPFRVGFGRMWHAYQLTQKIDDLTWEEIRDWHLNTGGWGALTQLNRFAQLLETHGIRDLMEMVINGEQSLSDIRTAIRSVMRYEADFDDALDRINDGANAGELGQFYRLVAELEIDPSVLDDYLADGMTLPELKHAAKLAERVGAEWSEIVDAKSFDDSWGAIGQAYKLADGEYSAADILAMGVQEFRALQRDEDRLEREEQRSTRDQERTQATADRLAEQFGVSAADVMSMYIDCDGKWGCVRKTLREGLSASVTSDRDERTAAKIASQYNASEADVWAVFGTCSQDWNCVRAHFRELNREERGKGNDK
jgi:PKD repeat protein